MKKYSIIIFISSLVLILFLGCNRKPEDISIKIAENFLQKLYSTPKEDIALLYSDFSSPEEHIEKVYDFVDSYKDFFTEDGFVDAFKNRLFMFNNNYIYYSENLIVVDDIKFTKISRGKKVLTEKDMIFTNLDIFYHVVKQNNDIINFKDSVSINLLQEDGKWKIDHVSLNIFLAMRDEFMNIRNLNRAKELSEDMFEVLYTNIPKNLCYALNHKLPGEKWELLPNVEAVKRRNELFAPLIDNQAIDYHGFLPLSKYYYHAIDNNLNLDFVSMTFISSDISETLDKKNIFHINLSIDYKTTSNDTGIETLYTDTYNLNFVFQNKILKVQYIKPKIQSLYTEIVESKTE